LKIKCSGKNIEIDSGRLIKEDINNIINDLNIITSLKEDIAAIIFNEEAINKKRIALKKLKKKGLSDEFIKMFIKLLDYVKEF